MTPMQSLLINAACGFAAVLLLAAGIAIGRTWPEPRFAIAPCFAGPDK